MEIWSDRHDLMMPCPYSIIGCNLKDLIRPDWRQVKDDVMRKAILRKF